MDTKTISADDLQILREAITQQEKASTNRAFVETFLTRKYELQNGDSIDVINGTVGRTNGNAPPTETSNE